MRRVSWRLRLFLSTVWTPERGKAVAHVASTD
jgi:hypothetical protein